MISNAALNACLNGLSGVLLACGYAAIRAGKKGLQDRKSTRLNSSHGYISYAVFCLKKKKPEHEMRPLPLLGDPIRVAADRVSGRLMHRRFLCRGAPHVPMHHPLFVVFGHRL